LLVVHEDAKTCGLGGDIIADVVSVAHEQLQAAPRRVTKTDDHNPYQFGLELSILPGVEDVAAAIKDLYAQCLQPDRVTSRREAVAPVPGLAPLPPVTAAAGPAAAAEPAGAEPVPAAAGPRRVPVVVPKRSPTDEDATLVKYFVKPGDKVAVGSQLVELEANKGSYEIESTHAGKVLELLAREGDRVFVDRPVMLLEVAEGVPVEVGDAEGEPAGKPAFKQVRLSPAQLQVGALALKSQLEVPTVSVDAEADITDLVNQRKTLQPDIEAELQMHVTYTHLILWALVKAMQEDRHEGFRGRLDADLESLWIEPNVNVGFAAVGPDQDLFSPVIKGADQLSFVDIVKRAQELTKSVRTGSINTHDLQGAQVTLTNIGAFETTGGTPFVMPGQAAMVCTGSLLRRPRYVAGDDEQDAAVECRTVLPMTLVFDHRPFNGSHAAGFLQTIKRNLESLDLKAALAGGR
jgi:pyruvate/2-oxoglutarate dehydrogenase complex dihydrolipoamide acyltransferase (E2) component